MKDQHKEHLRTIVDEFARLCTYKYVKGQEEHGGSLWEKRGLIDMAIDEAIDQVVYLMTLREQLKEAGVELGTKSDKA